MRNLLVIGVFTFLLTNCGDSGVSITIPDHCNPLGGAECVVPWPSAVYMTEDPNTVTGIRLDIQEGALPVNVDKIPIDSAQFNNRDGFSPAVQIFTAFPSGVDASTLPHVRDIASSITAQSSTIILDMDRGELVPHFSEVDVNEMYDLSTQALYLRPAARLREKTRYAVAIRKSVLDPTGQSLERPPGFQSIVDGGTSSHPLLEKIRPRYKQIFSGLEAVGIMKDDLVLAWDFVTGSDAMIFREMTAVRDTGLIEMGESAKNMEYFVDSVEELTDDETIEKVVLGRFEVPYYLTGSEGDDGIVWDSDGNPVSQGKKGFKFAAIIPTCAVEKRSAPMVVFGHGFFGNLKEVQGRHLREVAAASCSVVLGTEWVGLRGTEISKAALALNDLNKMTVFSNRIMKGILNHITLVQLAQGKLSSDLLVDDEGSYVDPEKIYFYGISQGHILGGTFMGYDPVVKRGVLHNGAANWSLMFERSFHWGVYGTILKGAYDQGLKLVVIMAILQLGFDYTDAIHVSANFYDNPIPNTPPKQLLMHMSLGDSAVSNVASMHQARTLGLPVMEPSVYYPFGMEKKSETLENALVIWDEKPNPPPSDTNILNAGDNGTHNSVRNRAKVIEQIATFLQTGDIQHTCGDGPCDCTIGACD